MQVHHLMRHTVGMSENRLLGHLAQRFAFSEENLATESLAWLMRSNTAKSAMVDLARLAGCDLPGSLNYVGQVGRQETGIPDIVATDIEGAERLIIEGKFAAGLTEKQPGGYLERLPSDQSGMLIVVAPSFRLSTLWVELLRAAPDLTSPIPAPSSVDSADFHYIALNRTQTLGLISWRRLVSHILNALRAADERALAADAEQLLSLTEAMDSTAFVPLRPQDLDQRAGHQINQLDSLIDATRRELSEDPNSLVDRAGRNPSTGRTYYGWYLLSKRTKVQMWFGFLPRAWARYGLSPLWLQSTSLWPRERWLRALGGLHEPGQAGLFDETDKGFLVPIHIPTYASRDAAVSHLKEQVEIIFRRLDAIVPEAEPPAPEVDIAANENSDSPQG
jgi:hypothetical protein